MMTIRLMMSRIPVPVDKNAVLVNDPPRDVSDLHHRSGDRKEATAILRV